MDTVSKDPGNQVKCDGHVMQGVRRTEIPSEAPKAPEETLAQASAHKAAIAGSIR